MYGSPYLFQQAIMNGTVFSMGHWLCMPGVDHRRARLLPDTQKVSICAARFPGRLQENVSESTIITENEICSNY